MFIPMYQNQKLIRYFALPITASRAHQVFKGFKITFYRDMKEELIKCPNCETRSDKA